MFSGIVEEMATLVKCVANPDGNVVLSLRCPFTDELHIDQSVAHNGVCLTVCDLPGDGTYRVTAIPETLRRTNLGALQPGDMVNLERSMRLDARLDGHIVQGHVDCTAKCTGVHQDGEESVRLTFTVPDLGDDMRRRGYLTVDKGSVTVNGVSLTVCDPTDDGLTFSVCLIPYTLEHTNLGRVTQGSVVNIEFDIIGKYVARLLPAK